MDEYIAKPIRTKEFFDKINVVLGATVPAVDESTEQLPAGAGILEWSEALRTVKGNHELLAAMIRAFLDESPGLMAALRDAVARSETSALRVAAHSLKGSMGYFGADRAYQQASRLETMARQDDLNDSPTALADLEAEMARLAPILQDYLDRHGPADEGSRPS